MKILDEAITSKLSSFFENRMDRFFQSCNQQTIDINKQTAPIHSQKNPESILIAPYVTEKVSWQIGIVN